MKTALPLPAAEVESSRTDDPPTVEAGPKRDRRRRFALISGAIAYLITFVIVLPLLWIVLLSFQPSGNILGNPFSLTNLTFDNYVKVIGSLPLLKMYGNTILIAVISVSVGTAV